MTAGKEVTPKDVRDTDRLKRYWNTNPEIAWGTDGDFDRCVALVRAHTPMKDPEGYCAERHHDATGIWPATHAKLDREATKKIMRDPKSHMH